MSRWTLDYDDWDPEQEPLREALCALGNGVFVTRGAAEEAAAGGPHYPGTYLAGGYDRLQSRVAGRTIENEDLVNWPNWLALSFRAEGGDWLDLAEAEVLSFRQQLDLRRGRLTRRLLFLDTGGRRWRLESRRIVHMGRPQLAAQEWRLTSESWSGRIEVRSALDGRVDNSGVERYQQLDGRHQVPLEATQPTEETAALLSRGRQSRLQVALVARTRLFRGGTPLAGERRSLDQEDRAGHVIGVEIGRGETIRVEKVVALRSSRDFALSEPLYQARQSAERAPGFEALLDSHTLAWDELWHRCDLQLDDDDWAQSVLRLHVFHLLQTVSPNTIDRDVGVPSRGLHGEAYRGHIFWDELFIFPFLNYRLPELTRELLMYRYRRLDAARWAAREEGLAGAMYPWQSGSDGREESQRIHLNPRSGRWIPDHSRLQRHVGAAIAYNVWQYHQISGDREFLSLYGAEMLLEIARFWASLATWDGKRKRYSIRGVVGPDEYHESYPGSEHPGLDDNAYTNVTASWTLRTALRALDELAEDRRDELRRRLGLTGAETATWQHLSRSFYVPFHGEGIISQFEGYDGLEELDWKRYREEHGDVLRLDRILEAEDDTPNRYKAAKQADVLMLFYLFSADELGEIFAELGYRLEDDWIQRNVDYYMERTSHGSTLSGVVHAWVLARSDRERSWDYFETALRSDVGDIQGGTTPEGIHLGAMAGSVDIAQRCYTGLEARDDVLWFNPRLPEPLKRLRLRLRYRGHWLDVDVGHRELEVRCEPSGITPSRIGFDGSVYTLRPGEARSFALRRRTAQAGRG